MVKQVPGIKAYFYRRRGKPNTLVLELYLVKRIPRTKNFFSDSRIAEAISQVQKQVPNKNIFDTDLGKIEFSVEKNQKTRGLQGFMDFYPFDVLDIGYERIDSEPIFSGKGIATEFELLLLEKAKRIFPSLETVFHSDLSLERMGHLERIGIDWRKPHSFSEYISLLKAKIERNRDKADLIQRHRQMRRAARDILIQHAIERRSQRQKIKPKRNVRR
ncbi:MAG: hypothetical protein ABH850_06305 [Candidatus Micrarchaeota archaeon]